MASKSCVAIAGLLTAMSCAVVVAGCASAITTPLPASKPFVLAMSADESKQAIDDLVKKGETHERDAEQKIKQSH
jgi:hypothetical protein